MIDKCRRYLLGLFFVIGLSSCEETNRVESVIPIPSTDSSPDIEYREFSKYANNLLTKKKFESLDTLADELRTKKSRFKDGRWQLTAFYKGMHPVYSNNSLTSWDNHEALLKEWLNQARKDSPTPHVALASFYLSRAWQSRGNGYASNVSPEAWEGWYRDLDLAKTILKEQEAISKMCPHWYNVMQEVALGESWTDGEYELLFKEAVSRESNYYFYYFSKANFYQSRWHGSKEKLMNFVNESVKNTFEEEGYTLYSRIYWSAEREFGQYMFEPGNVEWLKMKSGFEFMNKRYPNSIWNQNAYAHFACQARDKEATAEALKKVLDKINLGAWWSLEEYEYCRSWAFG